MQFTDEEILRLYHEEDRRDDAFNLLVKEYKEPLYWHIRHIVIDHHFTHDVLQNTFIKIWKGLNDFRANSMLFTWMYRIATNESLQFLRKEKKYDRENIDPAALQNLLTADPYFNGDDIQLKLRLAIEQLPERQKLVFLMRYYEDLKYAQIADILNVSEGGLKASYHHAVKKIEEILKAD